eukprot:GFUD01041467.1.p1 GENE.GFUD01041467.1~~GFUD01041467.1.p1  ORF type:complete len:401 (-),score=72.78 GFUD01041467.1:105-1307(-)
MVLIIYWLWCVVQGTEARPQEDTDQKQCSDYVDYGYYCVPFYNCDANSGIMTDGTGLIDPRITEVDCEDAPSHNTASTSKCSKLVDRCCLHPKAKEMNTCRRRNCGKRNMNGVVGVRASLPISVDDAQFGEWPHVCAVLKKETHKGKELLVYLCGGSLIDAGVILTAAHCPKNLPSADLTVRCGEWDTRSEDPLPYQEIGVETIKTHPCFNNDNHHNNFALLFLQSKFPLLSHISPVCLPAPGHKWPGGQPCVSNGWGKDKFGKEGKYANILKEVVVPLVKSQECQNLLREKTRLGPFFELDDSFICAGGTKDVDTCKGDGGSPLTCEQADGSWVQAGIVSWGIGCGGDGTPAVYASLTSAACWIDSEVRCKYGGKSVFGYSEKQCTWRGCGEDRWDCSK